MPTTDQHHIRITGPEYELPYSKGLMASRIMATGLAPGPAFHVAQVVEDRLRHLADGQVAGSDLDDLVREVLQEEVGEACAASYLRWRRVTQLDTPIVVLIGGATGVGKSTIATMLASRLGVTRVIPTDAIREVMRAMFSAELMPTLHTSSFDAARVVRHPLPRHADPLLIGFREQAGAIAVGVEALITRAVHEGTDLIVEGAHVVPGFLDLARFSGRAVVVQLVVTVDDEDLHRSHFLIRARQASSRPAERYLELFGSIRQQHAYVKSMALEHGVAVVPSENLDVTLPRVIDLVFTQAVEAVPEQAVTTPADSKRGAP